MIFYFKVTLCNMNINLHFSSILLFQFDLMLSEDGSGRGAALVAAVACRDN